MHLYANWVVFFSFKKGLTTCKNCVSHIFLVALKHSRSEFAFADMMNGGIWNSMFFHGVLWCTSLWGQQIKPRYFITVRGCVCYGAVDRKECALVARDMEGGSRVPNVVHSCQYAVLIAIGYVRWNFCGRGVVE